MNKQGDEYIQQIAKHLNIIPKSDTISQRPITPKTKPGQVYKLGNHRLMCGDTLNADLIKLLESDNPRLILTDPPYDLNEYDYLTPFFETQKDIEVLIMTDDKGAVEFACKLKKFFVGFYVIYFNSPSRYPNQPMMSHRLISHYRKGKSSFQNLRDAFATIHEIVLRKDGLSRQEKPLDLPRKFIIHYTKPEEQVLDLFGGSGSTMMACEITGRHCLTMEKDPGTCDVIINRWENYTHEKAILI